METKERPAYYAIIPANVRYDRTLSPNAKLLYGEITALTTQAGYCWATSRYFAELYDVTRQTVSEWISSLAKAGYIRVEIVDGTRRKIYLAHPEPARAAVTEGEPEAEPEAETDVSGKPDRGVGKSRQGCREKPTQSITENNTTREEEERASTPAREGAREGAQEATATVVSTLRTSGVLTPLKAETIADVEEFAGKYGAEALTEVVDDYIGEKPVGKIRRYVNVDLRERLADAADEYERQREEAEDRKRAIAEAARRRAEEEEERRNWKPIPKSPCPICGKPEQLHGFPCFDCLVSDDMSIRAKAREIKDALTGAAA
jgi:DNA-binding MarR family transcriptional regulator